MRSFLQIFALRGIVGLVLVFWGGFGEAMAQVRINEFVASNQEGVVDEDGDASDWIEIFNAGPSVNLHGWGLSDRPENPLRWRFPAVWMATGEHLMVWASGKNRAVFGEPLHTDFAIDRQGEELVLVPPNGEVVDRVGPVELLPDMSYGRSGLNPAVWVYFRPPSFGAGNGNSGWNAWLRALSFSQPNAFHTKAFDLEVASVDPDVSIHYTLDGSIPTQASPVYSGPIRVEQGTSAPEGISLIPTTPPIDPNAVATDFIAQRFKPSVLHVPPVRVDKAVVIRAMAVRSGALDSPVTSRTYWVDPEIESRFRLPVVSVQTDAANFFDHQSGIYVAGAAYRNRNPGRPWHNPANYRQRGLSWEKPIHLAIHGPDGVRWLAQDAGVRMHGGASRSKSQKTMRLYARAEYGESHFEHPLFSDRPHTRYKRLLLRNSGNDWNLTLLRDAMIHRSVAHLGIETQAYEPMVVYLNGQYWGIHNLRERYDHHYLERIHGVDPDQLDILSGSGSVVRGSATHYQALLNYAAAEPLSLAHRWQEIQRRMDVDNFIDYFIAEIFARNTDWPGNNMEYWRLRTEYRPDAPPGHDGRWRWLPFDLDFGWGYDGSNNAHQHNTVEHARSGHALFRQLLANGEFRARFVTRFCDQLNTAFQPGRLLELLETMRQRIEPEMEWHTLRWQRPATISDWQNNVEEMRVFARNRAGSVRGHLRSLGSFQAPVTVTVDVQPAGAGWVDINTVRIDSGALGLVDPDNPFPWTGQYFAELPFRAVASAADGYVFSHWEGGGNVGGGPLLNLPLLQSGRSVIAHFRPRTAAELLHYWSFNREDSLLKPTLTAGGAVLSISPGMHSDAVTMGSGQGFDGRNARWGAGSGGHLRLNNPSGTLLTLRLPTTGHTRPIVRYEARRSAQGARLQRIGYALDGVTFRQWQMIELEDADPQIVTLDFSDVQGASDNPFLALRWQILQGEGGSVTNGNQRIDNLTVDAVPIVPRVGSMRIHWGGDAVWLRIQPGADGDGWSVWRSERFAERGVRWRDSEAGAWELDPEGWIGIQDAETGAGVFYRLEGL